MASWSAKHTGHPLAFALALSVILAWAVTGPLFGFSDTWQLVINTGTTIVTFLMVFLIQNAQNRDGAAIQIKLDELIRATKGAQNVLLDLEELSENELEAMRREYERLAEAARQEMRRRTHRDGRILTGVPKVALGGTQRDASNAPSSSGAKRPAAAERRRSTASRRRSAGRPGARSS
jgi:low affinity Fe/Cu permease